jgi:hypothetical protein
MIQNMKEDNRTTLFESIEDKDYTTKNFEKGVQYA